VGDVLNVLRLQLERMDMGFIPSVREYYRVFGVTAERLEKAPRPLTIMHPGPMNRGVEIDSRVADGPHSVILDQVTNGVAVRMAVLYLLAGGRPSWPTQPSAPEVPSDAAAVLRGGRVIDPSRGVDQTADVLIQDGKIAAVGAGSALPTMPRCGTCGATSWPPASWTYTSTCESRATRTSRRSPAAPGPPRRAGSPRCAPCRTPIRHDNQAAVGFVVRQSCAPARATSSPNRQESRSLRVGDGCTRRRRAPTDVDEADRRLVVGDGSVFGMAHTVVNPPPRRPGAAGDRLDVLVARLSQVDVYVTRPGPRRGPARPAPRHRRERRAPPRRGDLAILDEDIGGLVDARLGSITRPPRRRAAASLGTSGALGCGRPARAAAGQQVQHRHPDRHTVRHLIEDHAVRSVGYARVDLHAAIHGPGCMMVRGRGAFSSRSAVTPKTR